MAARKKNNGEAAASLLSSAKETMRKLGVKKAFMSFDGYVFLNEADVRAYVGKDSSYKTVTDETEIQDETPVPEKEAGDKVPDEHKHIDETDGN